MPNDSQWAELEGMLKKHRARWMIWEGQPAEKTVERLRALGMESVVFAPCANRPAAGDFLSVMTENTKNLDRVFSLASGDQ